MMNDYDLHYGDMIGPYLDDEDDATLSFSSEHVTQKDCPQCPMYRGGTKPYCARTGHRIKLDDPLPLICSDALEVNPI